MTLPVYSQHHTFVSTTPSSVTIAYKHRSIDCCIPPNDYINPQLDLSCFDATIARFFSAYFPIAAFQAYALSVKFLDRSAFKYYFRIN